jgi:hypothetical protein
MQFWLERARGWVLIRDFPTFEETKVFGGAIHRSEKRVCPSLTWPIQPGLIITHIKHGVFMDID